LPRCAAATRRVTEAAPMRLTRRDFSSCLIGAGLGSALPGAFAQAAPTEGVHYVRLAEPAPAPAGKIEVIEFFWYECPHCNAFEPALEAWTRRLPDDVAFRRVPVWFREEPFGAQQRLFYTLDALGLVPTLHRKVFETIHVERTRLRTAEDMAAFALKNTGDVSEPVQSQFGWHVIRLDGRRPATIRTFDEARETIMAELRKRYIDEKREQAVAAIRRDPKTQVNREAVDALTPRVDVEAAKRALGMTPGGAAPATAAPK